MFDFKGVSETSEQIVRTMCPYKGSLDSYFSVGRHGGVPQFLNSQVFGAFASTTIQYAIQQTTDDRHRNFGLRTFVF